MEDNFFKEQLELKEKKRNSLVAAYKLIHKKDPVGLEEWEMARAIVEEIDDSGEISNDLAKECIYDITHNVKYPDDETRIDIVSFAEEKAKSVFPELKNIDEVHMDQIEYVYNKWKKSNEIKK